MLNAQAATAHPVGLGVASPVFISPDSGALRRPPSAPLTPTRAKRGRTTGIGSLQITPPDQQPPISGRSPFSMHSPTQGRTTPPGPSTPTRRPIRRVPDIQEPNSACIVSAQGDGNCFYRYNFNIIYIN
jgi:hypothetical protein